MFPFQINNYKASQPLDSQVQQPNRYTSQQQDQGFQQKQPMVLQIVSTILGMSAPQIQLPLKRKNIISNPLCIYTNNLFMYPQQIDHIPQQIKQLNIENNKPNQILQKITEIYSNEEPNAKISQFASNKKMICVYNRHNQNLGNKNDMTIYIKNIKIAVQNDMLKSFDKVLNEQNNNLPLNQNKTVTNTRFRLEFNSNFQGSNLHSVFWENNTNNYYLFLQNDINTHGYNQWYGFCARVIDNFQQSQQINKNVTNLPSRKLHKINKKQIKNQETNQNVYYANIIIVNISKQIKYKNSMKILIQKNGKWSYNTPFLYYKNKYQRYNYANYYTIHFTHCFQVDKNRKKQQNNKENNMVYFYLSYPFNYTKLVKYLRQLKTVSSNKWKIQIQNVGKSQGNNQIYMVSFINKLDKTIYNTLDNQDNGQLRNSKKVPKNKKKCVIILARQHPGQTVSSFICEHLINQIRNSQNNSNNQPFDWFIFPMANPDGVIHGNTRTNIKGYDINRCWLKNTLFFCSQVLAINKTIQQIREKYLISYVLDLHGHSRDYGSFAYFSQDNDISKVFNLLISQKCSFFNYYKSKYGIDYKKRPTFRGQMFYRNQIKNSITIEVSLFGQKIINQKGSSQIRPFTEDKFIQLSRAIYNSIVQLEETKEESPTIMFDKNLNIKNAIKKVIELQKNRPQIYYGDDEGSSADSDSDPQDQYLQKIERLSVGIDVPEEKVPQTLLNYNSSHTNSKQQYNPKLNKVYNQKIQQKHQIRTALLYKYNNFHKKNKQGKIKRKPIYTNSNVQILTFEKMEQLDKSLKKYSYDQSNQLLSQKTINQIKQTKNKRTQLRSSQRKINGHQMKSKQSLVYPTASNIKIDLMKAASYQQQDALYYSTKEWNIKQKNITNFLRQTKKQRTKSMICIQRNSQTPRKKSRKIQTSQHKRKESHKQLIKLKQYLLTKNKTKLFVAPKQEMNKIILSIVSKRIKTE